MAAFTLVEVMIVVVIIGLLAAMAVPAVQRVRDRSRAARLANDFKKYADAFQLYNHMNGTWPPAAGSGVVPAGMEEYLPASYTQESPVGGNYSWSGTGLLRLTGTNAATPALMKRVDEILDDGDLTTGDFGPIGAAASGNYHWRLH